jgi:hypothetical protein
MRDKLVDIALAEVGTVEAGGNNVGARVRTYQSATWLKPDPWPWCAAFTCWVLREWLKDPDVLQTIKDTAGGPDFNSEKWRCKDASAFGWEKWARQKGLQVLPETEKARAGDFVVFDFSHIGIVVEDQYTDHIVTVEGNTNGAGARDSETGDGVWKKTRKRSLVKSYIRII